MNSVLKITKFHLRDSRNALAIFYAIVIGLSMFATLFLLRNVEGNVQVGGIDSASAIFLFVVGLNSFTTGFRFMQANNVSRKRFYVGTTIALTTIAGFMAVVDTVYGTYLSTLIHYESALTQIYRTASPLTLLLWSFALYSCLAQLGLMITMMYYRSNKLLKMMLSLSPVIAVMVISFLNRWTEGAVSKGLGRFFRVAFGLNGWPNPYAAVSSFLVGAAGAAAISFLLIRRATLKAQG